MLCLRVLCTGLNNLPAVLCKALTSRCSMSGQAHEGSLGLGTYTAGGPAGPSSRGSVSMDKDTAHSSAELRSGRPRQSSPSHRAPWSAATADGPAASGWGPSCGP